MRDDTSVPASPQIRRRIAVGVYDKLPALRAALDGLALIGIGPSGVVLVADGVDDPHSLAGLLRGEAGALGPSGYRLVGPAGMAAAVAALTAAEPPRPDALLSTLGTDGLVRLADELRHHFDIGACVLLVLVDAVATERQVLKVLLATAIDRVQVHDVFTSRMLGEF